MIPILYDKGETQFLSNGLGRLTECLSCNVTEERNGIYECEFTYPVTGRFCKEMMENGGIISATHDNHGDRQAFDIYKFSAPIDGIVTFNARHISYRLNGIVVTPFDASSCAGALQGIKDNSANTNPFTFFTDKTVTAPYVLGVPAKARGLLAGSTGSILDVYGTGEYEFDMFNVTLHLHRGQNSGATIRYGKNLTDIVNILDKSGIYNAIAPYWTNGEDTVILPEVYLAVPGATSIICVPVDLTGDFEEEPSVGDLRADANRYLSNINPTIGSSNITIDFEALWQTSEYEDVAVLQEIGLCDTVSIYFPAIGVTQASAKAIKTVYDTLRDKYKSIEFGDPQTTLAESILGKSAESLGELSDGRIIGASIITAALIKAAEGKYGDITIDSAYGGTGGINFEDDGTHAHIGPYSFWILRDQRSLEAYADRIGIKFSPEKDGTSAGIATVAGLETVQEGLDPDWDTYEEAYGRLIIARVKNDEDNNYAPVQIDKVVISSQNGASVELYGPEINADLLTRLLPRKWQQFFSGSSVAVEIGNDGTKSYMILKNSSGVACVVLDTTDGVAFAIPVTASAGLAVTGGLSADSVSVSGDGSFQGDLTVGGLLDPVIRRSSASVSSPGWYRILTYTAPNAQIAQGRYSMILDLVFGDLNNDVHRITCETASYSVSFTKESCLIASTQMIDKIRYTYAGAVANIDVHYVGTSARTQWAFIETYLTPSYRGRVIAKSFTAVADAPTGETVAVTYDLRSSTGNAYNTPISAGAGIEVAGNIVGSGNLTVAGDISADDISAGGDASVGKTLDVIGRRCRSSISSAGWYRLLTYDAPTTQIAQGRYAMLIGLTVSDLNNEVNKVTLAFADYDISFIDDVSKSSGPLYFDKVRYVYAGSVGYVDVHFTGSSSRNVWADFDIQVVPDYIPRIITNNFTPVDDSPAGEYVKALHFFSSTTDAVDISSEFTFNNMGISVQSSQLVAWFDPRTKRVSIDYALRASAAFGVNTVFLSCNKFEHFIKTQTDFPAMIYNGSTGVWEPYIVQATTNGTFLQKLSVNATRVFGHIEYYL